MENHQNGDRGREMKKTGTGDGNQDNVDRGWKTEKTGTGDGEPRKRGERGRKPIKWGQETENQENGERGDGKPRKRKQVTENQENGDRGWTGVNPFTAALYRNVPGIPILKYNFKSKQFDLETGVQR